VPHWFTPRLAPALLVAGLLILLQWRSGAGAPWFTVVAATAVFGYVVLAAGRLLLAAIGEREFDPSSAYVLGLVSTCLGVYAVTLLFPVTAAAAFGAFAAAVIALELSFLRRLAAPSLDWRALIGFALCVAFTAGWCYGPANAYEVVRNFNVLPVWGDHFIHGARISQFGDTLALGRGSIFLSDYPSSFYHFASYLPAAAFAGVLNEPGLPLATSAWLPIGFLSMTAGAHLLGKRLAGAAGGLAAVAAVAILPDASNYGLRNGFLSFHWQVMAHPSAAYALGAAFLSIGLLDRWSEGRDRSAPLLVSGALAASTLFLRAHVFLLFLPAWVAIFVYLLAENNRRARRRLAFGVAVGLAATAITASTLLTKLADRDPTGQWRFGGPALERFLIVTHSGHEPTAYAGLYTELAMADTWGYSVVIGIVLAFVAALGAFAFALPSIAISVRRLEVLRPFDAFPAYLAYCWLLLMLYAPLTWALQGPELIDRPVVLVYAVCAIWTLCLLLRWLATKGPGWADLSWRAALAICFVSLPAALSVAGYMARPKFAAGNPHLALRTEPGLVETAEYLRSHARVGDVFSASGLNANFAVVDLPTKLCALTGLPAYLARPYLEMIKDAPRKELASARLASLRHVDAQSDFRQAMELLRRLRVQWHVVAGQEGPRWDSRHERAVFRRGSISLYAVPAM